MSHFKAKMLQILFPASVRSSVRQSLRWSLTLPQLRTKFGERAFSPAGPVAWNSMSEHIRAEPDIGVFMKLLKTHRFNLAFNIH